MQHTTGPLAIAALLAEALTLVNAGGQPVIDNPDKTAALPDVPWVQVAEHAAFSPRDTAEDAVFAGKMWLSNGYYHGNVLHRDLWNSTDGKTWIRVSEATPYDGYSELVVYKDRMWAVKRSVWASSDGETWEQVLEQTPFGTRGYGETLVFRDMVWQLGSGCDVWRTGDGRTWECVQDAAPFGKRFASAVVAFNGKLWLMAGSTAEANDPPEKGYKDKTTHNDVWCSEDGRTWTCVVESAPWPPRQWSIAKVYRDRIWLVGGHDNVNSGNLGDVWYSSDGVTWVEYDVTPAFSGRHEATCYVYDGSLWVVAGNSWPVQNDVWRLTIPPDE